MPTDASSDHLINKLRAAGLRATPQRLAIYRALLTSDTHPTAQALFEQLQPVFPSLSQATVYNTLQALVARGLIQEIGEAGDGAIHYDADLRPHVNLICTRCHRIDDLHDVPLGDAAQIAAKSGYQVHGMRIAYYGLCPRCQGASAT